MFLTSAPPTERIPYFQAVKSLLVQKLECCEAWGQQKIKQFHEAIDNSSDDTPKMITRTPSYTPKTPREQNRAKNARRELQFYTPNTFGSLTCIATHIFGVNSGVPIRDLAFLLRCSSRTLSSLHIVPRSSLCMKMVFRCRDLYTSTRFHCQMV